MICVANKDKKDVKADEEPVLEDDIVVLEDEEGKESKFKIMFSSLFVMERQYVVLMPIDQEDSAEPEIVILRVDSTDDGEGVLSTIDDDDEWEEVLKAFEEMEIEEDYDVRLPEEPKA